MRCTNKTKRPAPSAARGRRAALCSGYGRPIALHAAAGYVTGNGRVAAWRGSQSAARRRETQRSGFIANGTIPSVHCLLGWGLGRARRHRTARAAREARRTSLRTPRTDCARGAVSAQGANGHGNGFAPQDAAAILGAWARVSIARSIAAGRESQAQSTARRSPAQMWARTELHESPRRCGRG
jgi:hypothetical protein